MNVLISRYHFGIAAFSIATVIGRSIRLMIIDHFYHGRGDSPFKTPFCTSMCDAFKLLMRITSYRIWRVEQRVTYFQRFGDVRSVDTYGSLLRELCKSAYSSLCE